MSGSIALGGELRVNRVGFGAMRITGPGVWGEPSDVEGALRLLRRVVDLGINFIDTADSYGPQVSENLIARALHPYPAGLVIATKGGLTRPGPDHWERDAHPQYLRTACEASLERLRVDRIDVYQLHAPDPRVPLEDSLGELVKLQSEGKIRHIGVSNVNVSELQRARRMTEIVSVQNRYNVQDRAHDAVVNECTQAGIAFLPWAPLGSGRHAAGKGALAAIAKRRGVEPGQVAIAWLLARSPMILPIPGTASIAHLEQNTAAAGIALSAAEMRELD